MLWTERNIDSKWMLPDLHERDRRELEPHSTELVVSYVGWRRLVPQLPQTDKYIRKKIKLRRKHLICWTKTKNKPKLFLFQDTQKNAHTNLTTSPFTLLMQKYKNKRCKPETKVNFIILCINKRGK